MFPHEGLHQLLDYFTYLQQTAPSKLRLANITYIGTLLPLEVFWVSGILHYS
jgi:hypothetical protein